MERQQLPKDDEINLSKFWQNFEKELLDAHKKKKFKRMWTKNEHEAFMNYMCGL